MQENLANPLGPSFQILLLLGFVVVGVLFILTQQNTLKLIQPLNRMISPGQVWWQLIPIFGLLYQFTVVTRIARSLQREFDSYFNNSESVVPEQPATKEKWPTYSTGIAYCWLCIISIVMRWLPGILGAGSGFVSLAAGVFLIVYWVKLAGFKKKLRTMTPA
jgi:hypothetical protein